MGPPFARFTKRPPEPNPVTRGCDEVGSLQGGRKVVLQFGQPFRRVRHLVPLSRNGRALHLPEEEGLAFHVTCGLVSPSLDQEAGRVEAASGAQREREAGE